jgi:hypothetical protein
MESRITLEDLEREVQLVEAWYHRMFGLEDPDKKSDAPMYRYSKVAPNLYFGPKPPRYFEGKLKQGIGPVYMTKELSGIQDKESYEEIKDRGVIYGLASEENLNDEAELMRASNIKSGPEYAFDDNESRPPETLGIREMEEVLEPLRRAAEEIHDDMRSRPVLVTCKVGQNRSAAATALALVLDGVPPEEAIARVRSAAGNHLRGVAIRNKLFENYILAQTPGGPLLPASDIEIEKLVGREKLSEWKLRQIIRGNVRRSLGLV